MTRILVWGALAAACAALPAGAMAQDMVSANDPAGIAEAMKYAGYPAELTTDDVGDPMIRTEFGGYPGVVLFYDCGEDTHDDCQSLQLRAGLDRRQPMTSEMALNLAKTYRFAAVFLDDEGDPYMNWDILTGDAYPRELFAVALRRYSESLDDVADVVFAEERGE